MNNRATNILIVDDDEIVRESLYGWFAEDGYNVETAIDANEALQKCNKLRWDIYFLDIKMPGMDGLELHRRIREIDRDAIVIIITAYASVDTAVKALKEGAYDYVTKPFDPDSLTHLIRNALKQRELINENVELKGSLESLIKPPVLIGVSDHIKEIRESIKTVAAGNTTVIIRGESGTGKELVAQSIHLQSERKFFPLISVNCGAFSETLLESELFGHEKGAFTGAMQRRKGKLEIANGSSLFLDEIGAILPKTQVDLLRAIESKEFMRIGGNEIIKSDFRIICATNTNLEEAVKTGEFREDLYYRLQVYVMQMKPLRERAVDIPVLANYFRDNFNMKMNKQVTSIDNGAMDMLMQYNWPGNVRELENAVERAMVICKKSKLSKENFLLNNYIASPPGESLSLSEVEKSHILQVLENTGWNISRASKILNIDRTTIYSKLQSYGLKRP